MTRAIKQIPIFLRYLRQLGAGKLLSNCNYRPARCGVVYGGARLVALVQYQGPRAKSRGTCASARSLPERRIIR